MSSLTCDEQRRHVPSMAVHSPIAIPNALRAAETWWGRQPSMLYHMRQERPPVLSDEEPLPLLASVAGRAGHIFPRRQVAGERARWALRGRVALVHLGNAGGLGTTRRVVVWRELLALAGAEVLELNLLSEHRRALPAPQAAAGALRGTVVPESATWSPRSAARVVRAADVAAVVFVTARAFHPALAAAAPRAVLDFQDLFSRSYRGRAIVDRRMGASAAWRTLAWATERFERRDHGVHIVAAGWAEAKEIGAIWIPNTLASAVPTDDLTDHAGAAADVLFFGKLTALPNLDAVRRLDALWPDLRGLAPSATCLLAGNGTNAEIAAVAATHGWTVLQDFPDVTELCRTARVAVAPLRHANGIQNKVLEAAGAGLPQVVSPEALRGLAPGFPAVTAGDDGALARGIAALLADPGHRLDLARRAHAHVLATYGAERWAPTVFDLVFS